MNLGIPILSILPIVVLFVLIFTTKRMVLALTCATLTGAILLGGWDFAAKWLEMFQTGIAAGTFGYLVLLLGLFGILIQMFDKSGFVQEFAFWFAKFANTPKKALIFTYILGWIIFVDDYLNNLAISSAMKKVTDAHKIPRTALGYCVNSVAAPVCILLPFSTWAVFYAGLMESYDITRNGTGIGQYIHGIPFMFSAWAAVIISLLFALGIFPKLGQIKQDYKVAAETGVVCRDFEHINGETITAGDFNEILEQSKGCKPWNFLVPLALLIALTIIKGDVMIACMAAILLTGILILIQKRMKIIELFDAMYEGATSMVMIYTVIAIAMALVEINNATGMPDYVVAKIVPVLNGKILPFVLFCFLATYTYFCGGFWDGALIFMPIIVPLIAAYNLDPTLATNALFCTGALGSTWYICGDGILISSAGVELQPFYQMKGSFPYSLLAAIIGAICFLIFGLMA